MTINKNLFQARCNGDTYEKIARVIGCTPTTLGYKVRGHNTRDFTLRELQTLARVYNWSMPQIMEMLFPNIDNKG